MSDDTPDVIVILDNARLEEIERLRADNAKLREALINAQKEIRSATENWREDCFFNADLIMITALEETK